MKPVDISARTVRPSRDAGSLRGAMAGWRGPQINNEVTAKLERVRMQRRAADLAANDWAAESILGAIVSNSIGTGLKPSAQIPADKLGISEAQARELGKAMEWVWYRWSLHAGVGGSTFEELQALGLRTMLAQGEMLHIPVMLPEPDRKQLGCDLSLVIQAISPRRLRTPAIFSADPLVLDGVRFSKWGRPLEYYIAAPQNGSSALLTDEDDSGEYQTVKAVIGQRPGLFHIFARKDDEQVRGVSVFANSANLFRQLNDAIESELETQNIAAKFPIFITRTATTTLPLEVREQYEPDSAPAEEPHYYQDIDGPRIMYGNEGEKPEVLKNERPSSNFLAFVNLVQGGLAASVGLPSIAVTKDFSQVNYSSARAAMNEAWRTYRQYRKLISDRYCQPVWQMVMEEAWLRGLIKLPNGLSWYDAPDLWASAAWTGPARGYMDPTKEIEADVMAINNRLVTRHEVMAQAGRDYDDELPTMRAEAQDLQDTDNGTQSNQTAGGTDGSAD